MYGSLIYSGGLPGGGSAFATSTTTDRFIFDGYSLDTSNIRVQTINYDDVGDIDLRTFDAPLSDGGGVLGHYYHKKELVFSLSITASTISDLNDLIDEIKKRTRKTEGLLEILVNGEYRVCKASISSLKFNREYFNITFVKGVEITFVTMEPHFRAKDQVVGLYEGVSGSFDDDIDNQGTVGTALKIYYVFLTGNSGITGISISIGGYTTTITKSISDGDVVIIDGIEKDVYVNGVIQDYTGRLPELDVGSNPIQFDFVGTTVNCDIATIYDKKYK